MPEGHTIHRLAQDLARDLGGHSVLVSSPQGRFLEAALLNQERLLRTEAVGKHLFLHFRGRRVVHIHLGLFGRCYRRKQPAPVPRMTTRLRLEGPAYTWDLVGPTCCELLGPKSLTNLRKRLGVDPLGKKPNVELAWQKVSKTKRAIGAVLLDQSVFAGIGNVYRAELLFLIRLHPETRSCDVRRAAFDELWSHAKSLLALGVKERRIVTVPHAPSKRLKRVEALYVYKRHTCRVCNGAIAKISCAGRPIYACERCQPLGRESVGL